MATANTKTGTQNSPKNAGQNSKGHLRAKAVKPELKAQNAAADQLQLSGAERGGTSLPAANRPPFSAAGAPTAARAATSSPNVQAKP